MDFDPSPQETDLIARIRDFARRELSKPNTERDQTATFAVAEWKACGEQGLLGLPVPREYGGLGQGCLTTARIMEALGEFTSDKGLLFSAAAHMFACVVPIWRYAAEEGRKRWLPRLCAGEWIGAERSNGSRCGFRYLCYAHIRNAPWEPVRSLWRKIVRLKWSRRRGLCGICR